VVSKQILAICSFLALAACGGIGSAPSRQAVAVDGASLVPTSFAVGTSSASPTQSSSRVALYIGAGAREVTVTLTAVNGGSPPSGLTKSVTTAITPANCPCTVGGPLVPPGSDSFTFTTYDATNGTGNIIAVATGTFTVAPGVANTQMGVTLGGVPRSLAFGALPAATAGTSFSSPQTFALTVKDYDGNPITGTYANPVTVTDSDASGSQGSRISVNGGSYGQTVVSTASTDVFTLEYGGLAIAPATLTASASGATNATASFAPVLSSIVYSGPLNGASEPEIDLTSTSGTGSSGTFSASEIGWTTSPFNRSFTVSTSECESTGTISPASGTTFTFSAVAAPLIGSSCSIVLADGASQTKTIIGAVNYGPLVSSASSVAIGTSNPNSANVTISESNYAGTFSEANSCSNVANVSPTSGSGPSATFTISLVGPGNCSVTFRDNHGGSVPVAITATTYPVVANPTSVSISSTAVNILVTETNYTGSFTVSNGCPPYATTSPSSLSGPSATLTIIPVNVSGGTNFDFGSCAIDVTDSYGSRAYLSVSYSVVQ